MKIKNVLLALVGLASAILGIACYGMDTGSYKMNVTYGGDAYTGIQNAAAQSANNAHYLADIVAFGFGSVLLITGLVLIILAVGDLLKKQISIPAVTPAPVAPVVPTAPMTPAEPVVQSPVMSAPLAPAPEAAPAPATTSTCPGCGTVLTPNSNFCLNCGASQRES